MAARCRAEPSGADLSTAASGAPRPAAVAAAPPVSGWEYRASGAMAAAGAGFRAPGSARGSRGEDRWGPPGGSGRKPAAGPAVSPRALRLVGSSGAAGTPAGSSRAQFPGRRATAAGLGPAQPRACEWKGNTGARTKARASAGDGWT